MLVRVRNEALVKRQPLDEGRRKEEGRGGSTVKRQTGHMKKSATEKRRAKAEAKEGKRSSREVKGGSTPRDKRAREGRVRGHL